MILKLRKLMGMSFSHEQDNKEFWMTSNYPEIKGKFSKSTLISLKKKIKRGYYNSKKQNKVGHLQIAILWSINGHLRK